MSQFAMSKRFNNVICDGVEEGQDTSKTVVSVVPAHASHCMLFRKYVIRFIPSFFLFTLYYVFMF